MIIELGIGILSMFVSFILTKVLIPRLIKSNIVGRDVNKPDRPVVAEMGGIAVVVSLYISLSIIILLQYFGIYDFGINVISSLAVLLVVVSIGFIGMIDDVIDLPQIVKAFVPILASLPLVILKAAGSTLVYIPFIGPIDFGMFYIFFIIPLSITVSANLTNMLAGFNGMEAGMAVVAFLSISIFGFITHRYHMATIGLAAAGSFIGFLYYNKYPSKVFPGDTGTLVIGALIASLVIIDNLELLAVFLLMPYIVDFVFKMLNGFPTTGWWGKYKDGKLYSLNKRPVGFAQFIMSLFNGISEQNLVLFFVLIELFMSFLSYIFLISRAV